MLQCVSPFISSLKAESSGRDRFTHTLEAAEIGVWQCNFPLQDITWDDQVRKQFGVSKDQAITFEFFMGRVHPKDRSRVQEAVNISIERLSRFSLDYRIVLDDGSIRWIRAIGNTMGDEFGKPIRFDGITVNLTQQKATEEERAFLAEAKSLIYSTLNFESILDRMVELAVRQFSGWSLIHLINEKGELELKAASHRNKEKTDVCWELSKRYPPRVNATRGPGAVFRTGVAEWHSLVNEHLLRSVAQDAEHLEILKSLQLRSYVTVPLESRDRRLGTITFVCSDRNYSESEFETAQALGRELSIALENAELYRKAQRAIEIRDEFISLASHELRTPITPLKMQLQIAQRSAKKILQQSDPSSVNWSEVLQDNIDTFELSLRQVEKLTALIDSLLDVSKIQANRLRLELSEFNLHDLIEEVMSRYSYQMESAGITYEISSTNINLKGYWDRARLDQVLSNLISNAIKYGNRRPIYINIVEEIGGVRIEILDQGIGISKEFQQKMFKRFSREASALKLPGLGLGLYISQQIIEALGGRIEVESEVGKGSCFRILLPLKSNITPTKLWS